MMKLHASGEDYLEAILILQRQMEESAVCSIDLARHMEFSKPSISHAVGLLRDGSFLVMDKDGFLHLTDKGREVAENENTFKHGHGHGRRDDGGHHEGHRHRDDSGHHEGHRHRDDGGHHEGHGHRDDGGYHDGHGHHGGSNGHGGR